MASPTMDLDISSLPLETRCPPFRLRQCGGFWLPETSLPGIAAVHASFAPRPEDILLASFPKSGTTWLKALAFATLHRADHPPRAADHPLRRLNPHGCVKFLELDLGLPAQDPKGGASGVLATHLPYSLLGRRITAEDSGCRIVYICRDPKDAFVSSWLFTKKNMDMAAAMDAANNDSPPSKATKALCTLQEAFELFCDGRSFYGPQWHHVVGYWQESRRNPHKVLFLRYEEMLQDPVSNLKKLAEFMGCPFSAEEEAAGAVRDIVELCSLDTLRNMEVNRNGAQLLARNDGFFRKGVAGDWRNHMTSAMAARLDRIVQDQLQGSDFTFTVAAQATT
ncbi:cytosolic sulfotransferase 5 [Brachypodium distachyon]|uniref:Sulfotransferase n=1 Tax=Brachypodium distachyon TaxID=15368 RepID=I1IVP3_BRADI|nr:cytosolic sulfotransferase 5 [Brachypodium distachyon]KQJ81550.1 hypothetical protein BRADI_5g01360v3 [Brachypodium distachyon]|eukprot:XP_003580959.1 cytosolic sulfotransferase 5 [Brachypodium distachyon]